MSKSTRQHPPLAILHLSFLFSGAGTLLCGVILPAFTQQWSLTDAQSGVLIAAQFAGLFIGAIALFPRISHSLLCGYLVAALGFLGLSIAWLKPAGYPIGTLAFLILGVGLGQITTTVNLLSAIRYQESQSRSATLSLLNFTWSAGAVLSPVVAGLYLSHASMFLLLLTFTAAGLLLFAMGRRFIPHTAESARSSPLVALNGISIPFLLYFFAIFFLYGGFEATVSGWLSTYTYRYTGLGMAAAAYVTTTLWAAFAAGRAIAGALLRVAPERLVRNAGMLMAVLAAIGLRSSHTGHTIAICAIITGLGIGPFFPITFSELITARPSPRQAGAATANIALGSAVMPYLTGLISTRFGSLQIALLTPVFIGLALLILCSGRLRNRVFSSET